LRFVSRSVPSFSSAATFSPLDAAALENPRGHPSMIDIPPDSRKAPILQYRCGSPFPENAPFSSFLNPLRKLIWLLLTDWPDLSMGKFELHVTLAFRLFLRCASPPWIGKLRILFFFHFFRSQVLAPSCFLLLDRTTCYSASRPPALPRKESFLVKRSPGLFFSFLASLGFAPLSQTRLFVSPLLNVS